MVKKVSKLELSDFKYANQAVKKFSKGKYSKWNDIKNILGEEGIKLRTAVMQVVRQQRKIDSDPTISRIKTKSHPYGYAFPSGATYYYNKPKEFKRADYITKRLKDPEFLKFAKENFKPVNGLTFEQSGYKTKTGKTLKDLVRAYERNLISKEYISVSDIGKIFEQQGLYTPGTLTRLKSIANNTLSETVSPSEKKKAISLFQEIKKILGAPTEIDQLYKNKKYSSLNSLTTKTAGVPLEDQQFRSRWPMPNEDKIGKLLAAAGKHYNVYGLNQETEKLVRELYDNETFMKSLKDYKGGTLDRKSELFKNIFLKEDPSSRSYAFMKLGKILHGDSKLDGIKINKPLGNKIINTMMQDASKKTYGPMYQAAYQFAQEELRPFIGSNIQHKQLGTALKKKFRKYGITKLYNIDEVFPIMSGSFNLNKYGKGVNAYSMFSQVIDKTINQLQKRDFDKLAGQRTRRILENLKNKDFTNVNFEVENHKKAIEKFYKENPAAKGKVALQDFNWDSKTNTFAKPKEIFDSQFAGRYETLNPNLRKSIESFYKKTGLSINIGNIPTLEETRQIVDQGLIDISKGENITQDVFNILKKTISKSPSLKSRLIKMGTKGLIGAGVITALTTAGTTKEKGLTNEEFLAQQKEKTQALEKPETVQYNRETGSFVNPITQDKTDQNQLLQWGQENPLTAVAGTSVALSAQEIPRNYKMRRGVGDTGPLPGGKGRIRSSIGIGGALKPVLTTLGTPLIGLGFEGLMAKERLENDETMSDILMDPLGPAASLAFMEPLSRSSGVVRGAPTGIGNYFKNYGDLSNVGQARPGLTSKALRLGLSPRMIAGASRFLGLPGLALTTGLAGYNAYKNYQNEEGMIYNFFNNDE